METLRDELEFKNHKIEEYESMLQAERQRLKDMGQELQVFITVFTFLAISFWRVRNKKINVIFFARRLSTHLT